nr:MAG TPA: hypothetical protein [Caudoviricetes sp.]
MTIYDLQKQVGGLSKTDRIFPAGFLQSAGRSSNFCCAELK